MINLGLSAADQAAFEATLRQSHRVRTTVTIHDRNEKPIYTFDGTVISGSVQVDIAQGGSIPGIKGDAMPTASGPVRTLSLTVMRPGSEPSFLPDTPGNEVAFADNFVSVLYGVFVEGLSAGPGWVDVPVFWGPITEIDQDGEQFNISASGKETLGMAPCLLWDTLTVHKGSQRTYGVQRLLEKQGETRFSFPELNNRLTADWSFDRYTEPWAKAVSMARGGNWQLFYDGLGRARIRPWPQNRVWLFDDSDDGCLLSRPQVSYNISSARNTVEVVGGTPKGAKSALRVVSVAASSHPLSPDSLARNGQRRWMVHSESSSLTSKADAQKLADDLLFRYLTAAVDVQFDSLVIPHLEEGDQVAVMCGGQHIQFVLTNFTLPLTADSNMTIGSNRRVARYKRGKGSTVYLLGGGA